MQKRKLRIVDGKRTIRTYYQFRKLYPKAKLNRKTKTYSLPKKRVITKRKPSQVTVRQQRQVKPKQRIRKQVVVYSKNENADLSTNVYAEVRVLTLNPDISLKGLQMIAIEEAKRNGLKVNQIGQEEKQLGIDEERHITDDKIYISIKKGGKKFNYKR